MKYFRAISFVLMVTFIALGLMAPVPAGAVSADEMDRDAKAALKQLYAKNPSAKMLGQKAKGILVFPGIVKAGFIVGGQFGEGALIKNGKVVSYYNSVSLSYGLQAGAQKFGYALFFMTDSAMGYLDRSDGWEIGTGPSIVVVDAGLAKSRSTTTLKSDIYAYFFSQKGLMAGLGLQGTKITKIHKAGRD